MYILSLTDVTINVSPALAICISSGYDIGLTFESSMYPKHISMTPVIIKNNGMFFIVIKELVRTLLFHMILLYNQDVDESIDIVYTYHVTLPS
jgi:hypothetical protein